VKALAVLCLLCGSLSFAQELHLRGTVRDAATGETLPNANVFVKDGNRGTAASAEGRFDLSLAPGTYQIMASMIGFKTETRTVTVDREDVRLNIELSSSDLILQEVAVYSSSEKEQQEVSSISIQSEEIAKISSIASDVFHSVQALPGISVNNELSAKFNVRGGNSDENLVLVNDTQVYEPFHVKEADNASVGIFNMDMMKKVNLITGGFSAQYGDRLSSVLNIEYREGNREKYAGSVTASMTNFTGLFEGPLFSSGSFLLGARKSYTEYILSLIEDAKPMTISFYDVQGVLTQDLSGKDKLQVKFIHAGDDYKLDPAWTTINPTVANGSFNGSPARFTWNENDFERESARYFSNLVDVKNSLFLSNDALLAVSLSYYDQIDEEDHIYTEQYRNNFTTTANPDRKYFHDSYYEQPYQNTLRIKTLEPKISLQARVTPFYEIRSGFSYMNIRYNQDKVDRSTQIIKKNYEHYPDTSATVLEEHYNPFSPSITPKSYKLSGYVENLLQVGEHLMVNAGARIDYFDFNKDFTTSPRLSASYNFGDGIMLRGAWGHYYQAPIYAQLSASVASDTNTQSQKAVHYILSLERTSALGADERGSFTVKVEGYYKKYSSLISSSRSPNGQIYYSRRNDATGHASGLDLFVSLRVSGYYGWLSYGLLSAKEDLLADTKGEFPRYTDQRHTLSFVNDIDLGKLWSLNLQFTYGSGFAYTPSYQQYNSQTHRYEWVQGERNSEYLPAYSRVDVRLSKMFELFGLPTRAFVDVSNILNEENVYGYRYRYDNSAAPYREEILLWPILPTFGLTVEF
jgi:outer membrane receptor protein involved in Fe transport